MLVRTLLFTDVVNSTELSQSLGDEAMAALWSAHDRAARDLLRLWRGREIDKADGMLALFESPVDAAQYALAYHEALASLQPPLQARAGMNVGPVLLRENRAEDMALGAKALEVDGVAKLTAARVMSVARGGQTLATAEVRDALTADSSRATSHADVAPHLAMHSHGHWLLKGVADPIELFELAEPGEALGAPDDGEKAWRVVRRGDHWLPVNEVPNNLPAQLTSFVGRERELGELKRLLLGRLRMLTLVGMGGLGKTRVSLQLAAEVVTQFPDGVWLVDFTALRDSTLVASQAAQALGVRDEPGRPLLQSLCTQLQRKRTLLIFDNCEHLLQQVASLAQALLERAPLLVIVATSREPMRLPGEHIYPILPLPVPSAGDDLSQLAQSSAVQLFVQRARQHRPEFQLEHQPAPAIAALIARLEGIPLALELAAARVRTMSVADINRRLTKRYQVLTGGSALLVQRQQTLQALVDWSYDMLSVAEQRLLQRLAVFSGGFSLTAAEYVCADDELIPAREVMDLLSSLVEKSLVGYVQDNPDGGGEGRYGMLETLRDYAKEKLADQGGRPLVAARHCSFFLTFARQARNGLQGPEQGRWLSQIDREHDNLRVAMSTALAEETAGVDPFAAVKMAVCLQNFWIMRGHVREGRHLLDTLRNLPAVQGSDRALGHALYVAAALAWVEGDLEEARRFLDDCLARRTTLGDVVDVAATLSTRAVTRLSSGDVAGAQEDAATALKMFRESGHKVGQAISLMQLGQAESFRGADDEALIYLLDAQAIARALGHRESEGEVERALADLALARGDIEAATDGYARSLAICAEAGDLRGEAEARAALGRTELAAGRVATAAEQLRSALQAFHASAMRAPWLQVLEDIARLAAVRGDVITAVQLAGAAHQGRAAAGLVLPSRAQQASIEVLADWRRALGDAAFDTAWQQGKRWDSSQAQSQALTLSSRG